MKKLIPSKSIVDRFRRSDAPCGSIGRARRELRRWYTGNLGSAFGDVEIMHLEEVLPTLFGYHLLQIGAYHEPIYLEKSLIKHKIIVDRNLGQHDVKVGLRSKTEELAIATDSVDVVILYHELELHSDPHSVLREIDRVLVPEGRVIILGFNPWSMWGGRKLVSQWQKSLPWCCYFFSPFRVKDWLRLLGYDLEVAHTFFYRPPLDYPWSVDRLSMIEKLGKKIWPAFGAGYMLVAKKRVSTMTAVGPRWQRQRRVVKAGLLETREKL